MAGEFTRKIDQEFLKKRDGIDPELLRRQEAERKKKQLTETAEEKARREIDRILLLFSERGQFLKDRFPNMEQEILQSPEGIRYSFKKDANHSFNGILEFRCRDNEFHQALFVENILEITGKIKAKSDYITFSVDKVEPARIKKFIESKIFIFTQEYL
ncbi:MAG: hypothetical protein AABZ60_02590 [Planctomycetota bacterium]